MNVLRSFGVVGRAWRSVLPFTRRPEFWLPFLAIAAAQLLTLVLLVAFHRPGIQVVGVPIVRLLGGDTATHYPAFFFLLPGMFSKAVLVIAVLVASLATGAATLLFARGFGLEGEGTVLHRLSRCAPTLILVTALQAAVVWGLSMLAGLVPAELSLRDPMVRWGTRAGMLGCILLLQSLLAYVAACVVLRGRRTVGALHDSVLVAARTFLPTVLVVAVPILALYPVGYLAQRADLYMTKLRPEIVAGLLAARIGLEVLFGFVLVGAVTRLFLWRMEAAR